MPENEKIFYTYLRFEMRDSGADISNQRTIINIASYLKVRNVGRENMISRMGRNSP